MKKIIEMFLVIRYFDYLLVFFTLKLIAIATLIFFVIDFNVWNKTGKSLWRKILNFFRNI